jgi:predicted histone-like DNA-binding protein
MAIKYKLVSRPNLGKDAATNPTKVYAQTVTNGYVHFDEFCEDIAEASALTSADVKAMLDRMNYMLQKNLKAGRIVQIGELGNFRMTLGSTGSLTKSEFSSSQIKKPRIVFTPGKTLQTTRNNTLFERNIEPKEQGGGDTGGDGGDGGIEELKA